MKKRFFKIIELFVLVVCCMGSAARVRAGQAGRMEENVSGYVLHGGGLLAGKNAGKDDLCLAGRKGVSFLKRTPSQAVSFLGTVGKIFPPVRLQFNSLSACNLLQCRQAVGLATHS